MSESELKRPRIENLRTLMREYRIDAYLVPGTDAHQSEYVPETWKRREWISGFSGSAGDLVVTTKKATLWTDSRYTIQAEKELEGSGIVPVIKKKAGIQPQAAWLRDELSAGQVVGADPTLISIREAKKLCRSLEQDGICIKWLAENLIDLLWKERPRLPSGAVEPLAQEYTGESIESKLKRVREAMRRRGADIHVLSKLDFIAWLFNIRGGDVQYNPVTVSHAIVTDSSARLFVPAAKITSRLQDHLSDLADLHPYEDFRAGLEALVGSNSTVWLGPESTSQWIACLLEDKCRIVLRESPVSLFKAVKNQIEIEGAQRAHVRDGAALVSFLNWLDKAVEAGDVSEISAAEQLELCRSKQDLYRGPSFGAIIAYGEHGAIVHYQATEATNVKLKPEGLLLIDTGSQYLDGTTDITRTLALGAPTAEQRDRYTRVLKGHLALAGTVFPAGTRGIQLDTLARKYLWDMGLDYGHGTGHGIGSYLNVHEGPQAISHYAGTRIALQKGMLVSIEPGYYKNGEYGIRIENLVRVEKDQRRSGSDGDFYRFEILTLCPIDTKLLDTALLTQPEREFLNSYHTRIRETLAPYLTGHDLVYLERATRPV